MEWFNGVVVVVLLSSATQCSAAAARCCDYYLFVPRARQKEGVAVADKYSSNEGANMCVGSVEERGAAACNSAVVVRCMWDEAEAAVMVSPGSGKKCPQRQEEEEVPKMLSGGFRQSERTTNSPGMDF